MQAERSSGGILVASLLMAMMTEGCERHPTPPPGSARQATRISCSPQTSVLECRLILVSDAPNDSGDVVEGVVWATSDANVAMVQDGRVRAVGRGSADITASVPGRVDIQRSAVTVLAQPGIRPEIGYAVEGELRDANNAAVVDAMISLVVPSEGTIERAERSENGTFRFFPVPAGHYEVTAEKRGFRLSRRDVDVPSMRPVMLVLLPEPQTIDGGRSRRPPAVEDRQ